MRSEWILQRKKKRPSKNVLGGRRKLGRIDADAIFATLSATGLGLKKKEGRRGSWRSGREQKNCHRNRQKIHTSAKGGTEIFKSRKGS